MITVRLEEIGRNIVTNRPVGRLHIAYAIGPAGTGAAVWNTLRPFLDARIEFRAVRLPGRETRIKEPALRSIDQQVADILASVLPLMGEGSTPYSVIGHCSGAIVGYELTRQLELAGKPVPEQLVVIDQVAPSLATRPATEGGLSAEEVTRWLMDNGNFTSAELTPDVVELFLPLLEADLQALREYRPAPLPLPACDVTVIWDESSAALDHDGVRAWQDAVRGACRLIDVAGVRRLLDNAPERLAAIIASVMLPPRPAA